MNTDLQIGFQRRGAKVPRRKGNSFFAAYASWRLCVKSERAVRDKPRYSALFRLIGGVAPPVVRAIPRYSALNRDIPAYPGLSRDKKFSPDKNPDLMNPETRTNMNFKAHERGLVLRSEPERRRRDIVASHVHQQSELRQERHRSTLCRPSGGMALR